MIEIKHQQKVEEGQLVKMRENQKRGWQSNINQNLGEKEEEGPIITGVKENEKKKKK